MENTRIHAWVSGRVQGVFFRATTRRKAKKLNVKGWVKNLSDGRVEAVFEGDKDNVEKIVKWCHKGSIPAKVNKVETKGEKYTGKFDDFKVVF